MTAANRAGSLRILCGPAILRRFAVTAVWLCVCGVAARAAEPTKPETALEPPFSDFDDDKSPPTPEQLQSILREVPGNRCEIVAAKKGERASARVTGLFRLTAEWGEGVALRLNARESQRLQIHFWSGTQGVTVRYDPQYHKAWSAYGTLRDADEPQPDKYGLWATDEGRYQRCGDGTVEVQYHRGQLVLVRGDIALLRVPFDGPPTEVYLQIHGLIRGLSMVRCKEVPDRPDTRQPFLATRQPAELPWMSQLAPKIVWNSLPNGEVELSAEENSQQGQIWTTVRRPGLYEYIFEVDSPGVGTGVYLGDDQGKPLCRVGFFRCAAARQVTFDLAPPWSNELEKHYNVQRQVVPFASRRQCIRVVMGAGVAKLWTSGDGVHWSQVAPKAESLQGACWTVGLYCLPSRKARTIRLCALEVRQLDALASLAPESVQQYVDEPIGADNLETWEKKVAETRPDNVDAETWWRACAVRTLALSTKGGVGQPLLDRLQQRVVSQPGEASSLLRFLEESTLLRSNDEWQGVDRVAFLAERLGLTLTCQGETSPSTRISHLVGRLSFWTQRRLPLFSERLVRQELLARLGEDRLDEVRELCRRMQYWSRPEPRGGDQPPWTRELRHLVTWASSQSGQQSPAKTEENYNPSPAEWRHPLIERLSREGYNVLAELQAALDGPAYREAAQIISTSVKNESLGLLPHKRDRRLLVSMPVAVETAMREHPALIQAMQEQFGPLGRLRLRQALNAGDAPAVESVALQFYGTEAASEANQWLGDRALAAGRFAEAAGRYAAALRSAAADNQDNLQARLRLGGALVGEEVGKAVRKPVRIGNAEFDPEEFEALVAELRGARRPRVAADADRFAARESDPASTPYDARLWATLDGEHVQRPHAMPDRGIDWAGRQLSVVVVGSRMFVNNRVRQFAFDLATGRQLWATSRAPELKDQQWALVAMQPVVVGQRVFVRRLGDEGPELVCLDVSDGRVIWSCRPGGHVACDPLVLNGRLLVLSASYPTAGDQLSLSLVGLTMESGQVCLQAPLVELRDYWRHQVPCQAVVAGDKIVATMAGCVLACDASGRIQWLRRQAWIPPLAQDYWSAKAWYEASHEPPVAHGDRVYATQPGVWDVECIELATGRLAWRRPLGGLTRVLGRTAKHLLVETDGQIVALHPDSGKPLWASDVKNRLETRFCAQPASLMCVQWEPNKEGDKPPQLALLALDPQTGQPRSRSLLPLPAKKDPWLKPLVIYGDRAWCFSASIQEPARREIFELVPAKTEKNERASLVP